MSVSRYHLSVKKDKDKCQFEIERFSPSAPQGDKISGEVEYPLDLTKAKVCWLIAYKRYYTSLNPAGNAKDGSRTELEESERELLDKFKIWLQRGELSAIRKAIVGDPEEDTQTEPIQIFFDCSPELAELPWETWEIDGSETIHFIRMPLPHNPQKASVNEIVAHLVRSQRKRPRFLIIWGDEKNVNFDQERLTVKSLRNLAEVVEFEKTPNSRKEEVLEELQSKIADEHGWDFIYFAGHSRETARTGGEVLILSGEAYSISSIEDCLKTALKHGLQFTFFNSCNGVSIAQDLIRIGFQQVAVMRYEIHDTVAPLFFEKFITALMNYEDVCKALSEARLFLKAQRANYPSAYLVPSCFCHPSLYNHPSIPFFSIPKPTWKSVLQSFIPTPKQQIALIAVVVLSFLPSLLFVLLRVNPLLYPRLLVQSIYRKETDRVPRTKIPPIALVQIDQDSIDRAGEDTVLIKDLTEGTRKIKLSYLTDLIEQLSAANASIIGLDYDLSGRGFDPEVRALNQEIERSVQERQTWFTFATQRKNAGPFQLEEIQLPESIAKPTWHLQGYINNPWDRVHQSLDWGQNCLKNPIRTDSGLELVSEISDPPQNPCPFAYVLALLYVARQQPGFKLPQPRLNSESDLRGELLQRIDQFTHSSQSSNESNNELVRLYRQRSHTPPIEPIIDFSIPPETVYTWIPAWQVLDPDFPSDPLSETLKHQIVLIASGGYEGAMNPESEEDFIDNRFLIPHSLYYWDATIDSNASGVNPRRNAWTGGEVLAYTLHHLLTPRLVTPIPDPCLVILAALVGKLVFNQLTYWRRQYTWSRNRQRTVWILSSSFTLLYIVVGLESYISIGILLPVVLPVFMFWCFVFPPLTKKTNA